MNVLDQPMKVILGECWKEDKMSSIQLQLESEMDGLTSESF